jgi:hypothetical protein
MIAKLELDDPVYTAGASGPASDGLTTLSFSDFPILLFLLLVCVSVQEHVAVWLRFLVMLLQC